MILKNVLFILIIFKAKNTELENLHDTASKRLEELKIAKQTLVELKNTNKRSKKREKVEIIMEDTEKEKDVCFLEENWVIRK